MNKKYSVRIEFGPREPVPVLDLDELRAEEDRQDRAALAEHGATLRNDYGENRQDAIVRVADAALKSTLHEDASFKAMASLQMVGPKNDHNGLRSAARRLCDEWCDQVLNPALTVLREARQKVALS